MNTETKDDNSHVAGSTAGDGGGDGYEDVIVGASRADRNVEYDYGIAGASRSDQDSSYWVSSYVVFGKANGFSAAMDLSSLDGSNGFILDKDMHFYASGLAGASVSNAGDVNGDGFDDVIIGISRYGNGGSSYVVFGKASGFNAAMDLSSLDGKNGFRLEGGEENYYSGISVSTAGDVNGDGFDDLIIGSWRYQQNAKWPDSSYVVFGKASGFDATLNLSSFDEHDGFRLDGEVDDFSDPSVSTAGDVNSDGFDDLIVGSSYIIFGRSDFGIGGLPKIAGTPEDDELKGTPVAEHFKAGDGNDRIIGGGGADVFHSDAGDDDIQVLDLYFGLVDGGSGYDVLHMDGKDLNLDLTDYLDKIEGIETIDLSGGGGNTLTLTGAELQELSDITNTLTIQGNAGDRVILEGNWANGGSQGSYHTYLQGDAVVLVESGVFALAKTTINFSSLNGNNGFRVDGGSLVSNAGDVNGDGFDDVIVGAPFTDSNGYASGSSYVVFGKATGFSAVMDLSILDGKNGFRLNGSEGDRSGLSVSNAGDVNGDGFDDVIVGARVGDSNRYASGSSYVVFGKASGFSAAMNLSSLDGINGFRLDGETAYDYAGYLISTAGDVNGDGFDDVIVGAWGADSNGDSSGSSYVVFGKASGFSAVMNLSSLDGNNGFRLDGIAQRNAGFSVSTAGDVNGDGFDDLIVSTFGTSFGSNQPDSSYVVFGKASGFNAKMDLSNLNGNEGFRLNGERYASSGWSVSTAGDMNGDGFDDLIVGDDEADPNGYGLGPGSSYVIFGRSDFGSGGLPKIHGTPEDDQLIGTSAAEHFKADGGDDRMIGRGGADVFHGSVGDDYIQVSDLGFALVDGGRGNDVPHTDGKDLNLDLTDYLGKIQGIETICLYGRGDNTMRLTGAELQELSDNAHTLKVHGNAGDQVILEGEWIDEGRSGFYHTSTQDDAVLLVGMNMTAVVG